MSSTREFGCNRRPQAVFVLVDTQHAHDDRKERAHEGASTCRALLVASSEAQPRAGTVTADRTQKRLPAGARQLAERADALDGGAPRGALERVPERPLVVDVEAGATAARHPVRVLFHTRGAVVGAAMVRRPLDGGARAERVNTHTHPAVSRNGRALAQRRVEDHVAARDARISACAVLQRRRATRSARDAGAATARATQKLIVREPVAGAARLAERSGAEAAGVHGAFERKRHPAVGRVGEAPAHRHAVVTARTGADVVAARR
eukprot:CAMPEP_0174827696 /NCGR_PEP_ID=MMETSP1114-20130205/882_1 /TAXON_ID=312471 /ORGANISM="Neobodo designis, Strain CCAP 1951/1" /LENGTH=263 /DNA_ID=CAMNT_0016061371 /DNA_START=66 /DNA_END=854 /DNA_ORIENTATION=-